MGPGHEHRAEPRLYDAAGVQPVEAYSARLRQVDGREADVATRDRDLRDAGLAGPGPEPGHQQQRGDLDRRLAVAVVELVPDLVDVLVGAPPRQASVHLEP